MRYFAKKIVDFALKIGINLEVMWEAPYFPLNMVRIL